MVVCSLGRTDKCFEASKISQLLDLIRDSTETKSSSGLYCSHPPRKEITYEENNGARCMFDPVELSPLGCRNGGSHVTVGAWGRACC
jgi:hypothetical protein